jgi:monoamine oxidase
MTDVAVAVIGGGPAGIAAARTLADAGQDVLLLEAAPRLGGRAHTVVVDGMALDLGAGWLHSAEHNPWVAIAEQSGFTVDRSPAHWREQWRDLGFTPAEQRAAANAYTAFTRRLHQSPPASDRAGDALEQECEWNLYLHALSGFINSVGFDRVSVSDYLAYEDAATEHDWRVREGYGALVVAQADRVPTMLAAPVTRIDGTGTRLRIETSRGVLHAQQAIVTASTSVLASGAIRFDPALDPVLHAAACLPLGLADKLFLALHGDEPAEEAHLLGNPRATVTGTYTLRPLGRPVVEVMFGGEGAVAMADAGLDGAAAFAIDELCALLGSDWRRRLRLLAGSSWRREPFVRGGYSHALPGHAAARTALATPLDPRIRFAGEACSTTEFSTVHGAYRTGVAAAEAVLAGAGANASSSSSRP